MEFREEFAIKKKFADDLIKKHMLHYEKGQDVLAEAMNYALEGGGKRLRPLLMVAFCELCGGRARDVYHFAAAIEMIHTYSLIHDDLPAMDNDALRRGRKTVHIVYGEDMAILAGDALLTYAFEVASQSSGDAKYVLKAINLLANCAGGAGMVGGQVLDLLGEKQDQLTYEALKTMDSLKTGALIYAAGHIGAMMAGAAKEQLRAVDKYCSSLGVAFQIQDDLLDIEGDEAVFGKPIGSDIEEGKNTYVSVLGIEKARSLAEDFTREAMDALAPFGDKASFLIELAGELMHRKK